jgi:hypothetical protein
MQNKKYWRWNHPNWSTLRVVEADQIFVKSLKIGLRLHTFQIFDFLLRLTEWTNLDDSKANISLFCI